MSGENPTESVHMRRLSDPESPYQPPQLRECPQCGHRYQLAPGKAGPARIRQHLVPDSLSSDLCPGSLTPAADPSRASETHWMAEGQFRTRCCHRLPEQLPSWHIFSPVPARATCTGRNTEEEASAQ